jgi:hypothetical protein
MVTIDRGFFSLRSLSQGQLRWSPSSRDNTLLSRRQSDHDLRGDSANEYQEVAQNLPNPDRLSRPLTSPLGVHVSLYWVYLGWRPSSIQLGVLVARSILAWVAPSCGSPARRVSPEAEGKIKPAAPARHDDIETYWSSFDEFGPRVRQVGVKDAPALQPERFGPRLP